MGFAGIEIYKSFLYVVCLNTTVCLGTFVMGYYLTVYNALIPQFNFMYGWDDPDTQSIYIGIVSALIPGGAFCANLISEPFFDKVGRKRAWYIIDIVNIIGAGLTLIWSFPALFIGRFLCGLCVGWNSILVGMYMNEINFKDHSHIFGLLGGFTLNFGIMVSFLFGLRTMSMDEVVTGAEDNWWRFMFGFPMIICFIRMLLVRFIFNLETPFYLIQKKKLKEARGILAKMYVEKEIEGVFQTIEKSVDIIQKKRAEKHANPLFEIVSKRYFLRFTTRIVVGFANQLIAPVMMYSKPLFTTFSGSDTEANNLNGILGGVNLFSGLLISLPLRYWGVRSTFLISLIGCTVFQGLIGLFFYEEINIGSLISMYFINFFFNLGCGPALFLIPPKILPDRLLSICFVVKWVFGFITTFCFPIMLASRMDVDGSFLLMMLFFFVFMIFIAIFLPEIKEKTPAEISIIYSKEKYEKDQMMTTEQNELK